MKSRYLISLLTTLVASASWVSAQDKVSLLGTWKAIGDLPDGGKSETTLTITAEGDKLKAVAVGDDGEEYAIDRIKRKTQYVTIVPGGLAYVFNAQNW